MHKLLLLVVLGFLAACQNRDVVMHIDWADGIDVQSVHAVDFTLQIAEDSPRFLPSEPVGRPYVFTLPEASSLPTEVQVSVEGRSKTGCRIAGGQARVQVAGTGRGPTVLRITTDSYVPTRCAFTLNISGSGTVRTDLGDVQCSSHCTKDFPYGTTLYLTATPQTPARNYLFDGPLPSCHGPGGCKLTIQGETTVAVRFPPPFCKTPGWCRIGSVPNAVQGKALSDVFGKSPNEIYIVGESGTVLLLNGTGNLSQLSAPGQSYLHGVGATAPWAIGSGGALWKLTPQGAVAASETRLLTPRNLIKAWGPAQSNDAWAVGLGGALLRRSGGVWKFDMVPVDLGQNDLLSLWGSGVADVWAVGAGGRILHWDGNSWQMTDRGSLTSADLQAVWGSGATDVWAVDSNGQFIRWNGATWRTFGEPFNKDIVGLSGSGPSDIWAVGEQGTILHFDGSSWQPRTESGVLSTEPMFGVFAHSPWEAWAVGAKGTVLAYQP